MSEKKLGIEAECFRGPDGSVSTIIYSDIPLEAFSDERFAETSAAIQLAELRARAKLDGRKVEH
jgi:hypothetical protein